MYNEFYEYCIEDVEATIKIERALNKFRIIECTDYEVIEDNEQTTIDYPGREIQAIQAPARSA